MCEMSSALRLASRLQVRALWGGVTCAVYAPYGNPSELAVECCDLLWFDSSTIGIALMMLDMQWETQTRLGQQVLSSMRAMAFWRNREQ
jgi:hypothetical protein